MAEPQEVEPTKFDVEIDVPKNVLKIASNGLTLLHEKKANFDHHLCNKVLGYREVPYERPLRPNHAQYLIQTMMRDTFHPEWVRFIVCKWAGEDWRMNGQHTAFARLEMPKDWKGAGQVGLMTYEAESSEAMRELYASCDRGAPRTRANIISSYLTETEQFDGIGPNLVKLLSEGLSFWLWEGGHARLTHDSDEIAYLMQHTHKSLVSAVAAFCVETPALWSVTYMRRASVVAAMYETFSKVAQASIEFWTGVKLGTGFDTADDPRLRLRNFLMEAKLTTTDDRSKSKKVNRENMYRICINAFNRWRKGESCKSLSTTKERQRAK